MILKKLGVAMLAALVLSAVVAGTSQAAMWNASGTGTWASGNTTPAWAKVGAKGNTLTSKILGSPFKITSSAISAEEGKITQSGSSALLTGKLVFEGLTVVEPAGCKTTETIKSTALIGTAQMGNTEATTENVYVRIAPASGEVIATIPLSGCAAAGSYQVKGVDYIKAVNPTGTAAEWQEAVSSGAINSSQGGALTLGKEAATLEGTIQVALLSATSYSLQP